MPTTHTDPQVTITIDTAYRAEGVAAANKGLQSVTTAARDLEARLDTLERSAAPGKLAEGTERMGDALKGQPTTLESITEGWQRIGRGIAFASESVSKVMWVATLVNGSLELGAKLWQAYAANAEAAAKRAREMAEATRQEHEAAAKAYREYAEGKAILDYERDLQEARAANVALLERELDLRRQAAEAVANTAYLETYRAGTQDDLDKARLDTELARGSISQAEHARRLEEIDMEARARQRAVDEEAARRKMTDKADIVGDRKAMLDRAQEQYDRNRAPEGLPLSLPAYKELSASAGELDDDIRITGEQLDQAKATLQQQLANARYAKERQGYELGAQAMLLEAKKTQQKIDDLEQRHTNLQANLNTKEGKMSAARDFLTNKGYWGKGDNISTAIQKWQASQNDLKNSIDGLKAEIPQLERDYLAAEGEYKTTGAKNDADAVKDKGIKAQHEDQRAIEQDKKDAATLRQGDIAKAAAEVKSLTAELPVLEAAASELEVKSQESRQALATYGEWADKLPKGRTKASAQALQDRMERYLANADQGLTDPDAYRQLRRALNRGTRIPRDMRVDLLGMLGDATRAGGAQAKVTTQRGRIAEAEERKAGYEREPQLGKVADDMRKAADNASKAIEALADKATKDEERVVIRTAASSLADGYQTSDLTALKTGAQQLAAQGSPLAGQYIAQVQSVLQLISSLTAQQQQLGAEVKAAQRSIDSVRSKLGAMSRAK